jgi:hypothetical protein
MARELIIEMEFDIKTGEMRSDTLNFIGKDCEKIQDELTKAVAGLVLEVENKPEKEAKVQTVQISKQNVSR